MSGRILGRSIALTAAWSLARNATTSTRGSLFASRIDANLYQLHGDLYPLRLGKPGGPSIPFGVEYPSRCASVKIGIKFTNYRTGRFWVYEYRPTAQTAFWKLMPPSLLHFLEGHLRWSFHVRNFSPQTLAAQPSGGREHKQASVPHVSPFSRLRLSVWLLAAIPP
jgi:hypothetical protein